MGEEKVYAGGRREADDVTNLNQINSQRQLLRVFGGLNEGYACSEAELSEEKNFSSRGYPALETRKPRRKVRQATGMNGMYHLNGLLTVEGTTLRYAPDDGSDAVELKNALTDSEKKMVGMGTKVLIWPDKMSFDTAAGTLSALGSSWQQGGRSLTVTPCDAAGVVYTPNKFGATEPKSPENGDVWLKQAEDAPWSYRDALKLYSTAGGWQNILLNYCRVTCEGLGKAFKAGDTVTLTGIPGVVKNAYSADFGGDVVVDDVAGDSVILSIAPDIESVLYYGTCVVTGQSVVWTAMDGKTTQTFDGPFPDVTAQRRVPDLDWLTEHNNRVWGCSSTENVIYACKLGDATNWFSYRGTAADSYAVTVGSDGAFTGAATCMGYVLFFKENGLHKLYGTKPSDYQMSSIQCSGVAKGAHQSLCVINQTLYYLSMDGVMAWDGSLPTKVSASLDETAMSRVTRAAAGGLVGRYYLHTESPGGQRLLVYDTEKGLWHEEDATGWAMCSTGRQLYLWDKEAIWAADGSREAGGEEDTVEYEAVTGDIGLGDPDDKYCSRVTVRLDAMERTVVTLWASFDGGEWQEVGRVDTAGKRVRVNLPFVPTRHDTMRLRLTGKGQIAVRSIAMTLSNSEGGRVNGGVPRRG